MLFYLVSVTGNVHHKDGFKNEECAIEFWRHSTFISEMQGVIIQAESAVQAQRIYKSRLELAA